MRKSLTSVPTSSDEADFDGSVPRWMARPSGPGLWLCECGTKSRFGSDFVGMRLTQEDLDRGAPFLVEAVYGPIPERTFLKGDE